MSKMDLRSSRSRSKTPFVTQEFVVGEVAGNHVEKTVTRTTRSSTVYKTNESASSSTDEVNTSRETITSSPQLVQQKSSKRSSGSSKYEQQRSLRNRIFKTSDYSSEDGGENEVSSSRTVKQNERNQLVEDARKLANGSEMPALELYKRSGRYWDDYPKTDWTYSRHSKDRVEIAPGVVAMPNMSRKTIHSLDESTRSFSSYDSTAANMYSENVSHKNVNTDNMFTARYSAGLSETTSEDYYIKRRTYSRWSYLKQTVTTIFTSIFTVFYYTYRVQTGIFSQIHRVASKLMLWDTYLLWKSRPGNKTRKLAALCLLPLLLFGGLWFLSGVTSALYGAISNYTTSTTSSIIPSLLASNDERQIFMEDRSKRDVAAANDQRMEEKIVKITEKVYVEPPSAAEIAGSLTKEQIEAIAMTIRNSLDLEQVNTEELVRKIVNNPSFVNVINNYYQADLLQKSGDYNSAHQEQQLLIHNLLKEIDNMKQEIMLNNKLRNEDYARLSLNIKKCCEKRPIINIEGYVSRTVTDLLNNPEFLRNQRGLNEWLRTLFAAKLDLEYHLGNLTMNMDAKLADVVQSNSQLLMDQVAAKLVEINRQDIKIKRGEATIIDDGTFVKNIVKEALAIYDADRTGLVDYAMENMGGQIVTTRCTELYHYGKAVVSVLGIPLWHVSNSPRTVITPTIAPGDCWAFQNFPGFVVVKLSSKVKIDAFSMEHISKLLIPDGKMDSAPKDFEVYGLKEENDREPVLLGIYKYEYNGDPLQFFLVEKDNQVFDMIEVRIVSNHGNPNYTCLYRFRVHGKLHHEEDR